MHVITNTTLQQWLCSFISFQRKRGDWIIPGEASDSGSLCRFSPELDFRIVELPQRWTRIASGTRCLSPLHVFPTLRFPSGLPPPTGTCVPGSRDGAAVLPSRLPCTARDTIDHILTSKMGGTKKNQGSVAILPPCNRSSHGFTQCCPYTCPWRSWTGRPLLTCRTNHDLFHLTRHGFSSELPQPVQK